MLGDTFGIGQLFALSRDPVVCVKGGHVTYMNPPAVSLFGGNLIGVSSSEIFPETLLSIEAESYFATAELKGQNVNVSCTTYEDIQMYSFMIPVPVQEQTTDRAISVSLRELTNTIKATADQILTLSEAYEDEKLCKYTAILRHSSCKLKRLILNYSLLDDCERGTQAFSPFTVSLNELCEDVVDMVADLARDRDIQVQFCAEESVQVCVDVQLIQHLLLNLLCNSLQHAPAGSTVRVSIRTSRKFVTITVTDQGPGIHPQQMVELFQQYDSPMDLQRGQFSAGLGLAVADRIAKLHGGAIVVNSSSEGTAIAAQLRRVTDRRFMSPRRDFHTALTDTVMTELAPWLTWKDYLRSVD